MRAQFTLSIIILAGFITNYMIVHCTDQHQKEENKWGVTPSTFQIWPSQAKFKSENSVALSFKLSYTDKEGQLHFPDNDELRAMDCSASVDGEELPIAWQSHSGMIHYSPKDAGSKFLHLACSKVKLKKEIPIIIGWTYKDNDQDGFYNELELYTAEDRETVRYWILAVSFNLLDEPSVYWHQSNQDCSGLVRFAYTEALRLHDIGYNKRWKKYKTNTASISAYQYPELPYGLGENAFRIQSSCDASSYASCFSNFADGNTLKKYNTHFIGRSLENAENGDLLFFEYEQDKKTLSHLMIYIRKWQDISNAVIYHTGASPEEGGEIRLVAIGTLNKHPHPIWHVTRSNDHWLGVFRWNILDN